MRATPFSLRRALVAAASGLVLTAATAPLAGGAPAGAAAPHHATAHLSPAPFTWSSAQVDTSLPFNNVVNDPHPVSCPLANLCVMANGATILTTANPQGKASAWHAQTADTGNVIQDITCVTNTNECVAVDNAGNEVRATGIVGGQTATWTVTSADSGQINSISCPTTTECVAVDSGGNVISSTNPFASPPTVPTWTSAYVETALPLVVLTSNLPVGQLGVAYPPAGSSATLAANGGTAPYSWSIPGGVAGTCAAGSLEIGVSGLCLATASGVISGTPTNTGAFTFTAAVTDAESPAVTATANLTLTVAEKPPLTILSTCLPVGHNGAVYAATAACPITLTATGGTPAAGPNPYTWGIVGGVVGGCAAGHLQVVAGLCLTTATGAIAGTPTVNATTAVTFTVTDNNAPAMNTATGTITVIVTASGLPAAITILSTNLPIWPTGSAYDGAGATLGVAGDVPADTWSVSVGSLPPGLVISSAGVISGTPTASGTFNFTVKVVDSTSASTTQAETITIVLAPPMFITNTCLPIGSPNSSYPASGEGCSSTLTPTGGTSPYTFAITVGSLPPGLSLGACPGASCGKITGTPTTPGTYRFTVLASDSQAGTRNSTSASFLILIAGIAVNAISCPTASFCAAVDGQGAVLTSTNPTGGAGTWSKPIGIDSRNQLTVLTTNLPEDFAGDTNYSVTLTATGGVTPYNWSILNPGALAACGLQVLSGKVTDVGGGAIAGTCVAQILVADSESPASTSTANLSVTVAAAPNPVTVTTTFLPEATVGSSYAPPGFTASGGTAPYTFSLASGVLPPGLSLAGGLITGTPTISGTFNFTVTATDSTPTTSLKAPFTIIVTNGAPSLTSISCPSTSLCEASDSLGNILSSSNPGSNNPSTWSIVDQDGANKPITVVTCPTQSLCMAGDSRGGILHGTSGFTVTTTGLPTATVGVAFNAYLSATNGITLTNGSSCNGSALSIGVTQGFCWTVTGGASSLAAAGLSVNPNGTISGLPTVPGTYLLTVQVQDGSTPVAQVATATIPISIGLNVPANVSITTTTLPSSALGEPYITELGATGGTAPYNWSIQSGALPPGLSLGTCPGTLCGVITGTPTATGTFAFAVQVNDSSAPVKSEAVLTTISINSGIVWAPVVGVDTRTPDSIGGLSCSSISFCLFADNGGAVEYSTLPTGPNTAWITAANQITAISCPNSNLCVASDTNGNLISSISPTQAQVTKWPLISSAATANLAQSYVNGLACDPSSTVCAMVNSADDVISVTSGGLPPWSVPSPSLTTGVGPRSLEAVSCPTVSTCFAADSLGHILTLTLPLPVGALSLSNQPPAVGVDTTNQFTGISCPSINLCVAVDNAGNIVSSTDPSQGTNAIWSIASHVDGTRVLDGISCPSTQLCVAVDASGNVLTSTAPSGGNSAWSIVTGVDSTWLNAVSCPTASFCAAVDGAGNVVMTTAPTGAKSGWTPTNIDGTQSLDAISCATPSVCVAADANGDIVAGTSSTVAITLPPVDNGVLPSSATVGVAFAPALPLGDAECPTAINTTLETAMCASGGTSPYTWTISAGSLPPGVCLYPAVASPTGACPASVQGTAAEITGTPTATGTFTFTVALTDSSSPPQSATLSGSITVAGQPQTYAWLEDGNNSLVPGGSGTAFNDGANPIDAVSCNSIETCLVTDDIGNTFSTQTAGSTALKPPVYPTWTSVATAQTDPPFPGGGPACVPDTGCNNVLAVACPAPASGTTLCVIGDKAGNLLSSLNPTAAPKTNVWCNASTAPPPGQPSGTPPNCSAGVGAGVDAGNAITAVACPSVTLCLAVDNNGHVITTTNANVPSPTAPTWTVGTVDSGAAINAITCPSTSLCVAVDSKGNVLTSPQPSGGAGTWSVAKVDSFTGTVSLRGNPAALTNELPIAVSGLTSVSCSSVNLCVAVDAAGNAVTSIHPSSGATAWKLYPVDTNALDSVSCSSDTFCLAVDDRGDYTDTSSPNGGSSAWMTPTGFQEDNAPLGTVVDGSAVMNSVDCPSTALCLATDQSGNILFGIPNVQLAVLSSQLPAGAVGTPYSQSLTAIGGVAPYSWTLPAGSTITACPASPGSVTLPATGLCLSPAGTISGIPTSAGTFSFPVLVTDSSAPAQSAIGTISITVAASPLQVVSSTLPTASLDTQYTAVVDATGGSAPYTWSLAGGFLPTGLLLTSSGAIFGKPTISGVFSLTVEVTDSSSPPQTATAALVLTVSSTPTPRSTQGYWLASSDGYPFAFGAVGCPGGGGSPCAPSRLGPGTWVAGIAATPDNQGFWLASSDGGVFTYGTAGFYGSMGGKPLARAIVGIAATADGLGYWIVGADGGIFAFGDAAYYGSTASVVLRAPIVSLASTPDGHGYWLVASDGGVFAFGDAAYYGSTGSIHLNEPVVGIASSSDGRGYWLVASDGAIFTFGDALFYGSIPGVLAQLSANQSRSVVLDAPIVAMVATSDGLGYWIIGADGGIFTFGDAVYLGSQGVGVDGLPITSAYCNPPSALADCNIVAATQ